jgi:hypothetical protein
MRTRLSWRADQRAIGDHGGKNADADEGEQKQRHGLQQNIDQDGRTGEFAGDAEKRHHANTRDFSADLCDRQQRVDRFADEAH